MACTRRKFLKAAGLTTLGIVSSPLHVLAQGDTLTRPFSASLPQESPLTAGRWAMAIDLRKCLRREGCRECVTACHRSHNVPEFDNPKDEIKWIWKEEFQNAFHEQEHEYIEETVRQSHLPVLCNHCNNPPCVRVCPTGATWKRDQDGIVMMDWHRCIGCRYCIVACPYGSRSFNWRDPRPFITNTVADFPTRTRGVVEKCTFCEERLARGLLPGCVEACREGALVFGDLEDAESAVRRLLKDRYSIRRKPGLGTQPEVYYLV